MGGVSVIMDPTMTLNMSEQGVLASDGICKTFDSAADGFARGEAAAVIFIKPLADALRDGDPVRAIIRGTSVNSDGKTIGLSNPSPDAQEQLIRKAYRAAGISDDGLSATPYIECHGTGTQTGDAIETAAIANAFAGDELKYICSVNIPLNETAWFAACTMLTIQQSTTGQAKCRPYRRRVWCCQYHQSCVGFGK